MDLARCRVPDKCDSKNVGVAVRREVLEERDQQNRSAQKSAERARIAVQSAGFSVWITQGFWNATGAFLAGNSAKLRAVQVGRLGEWG